MNKFQNEVKRRTKKALELVGLGDMPYRMFVGFVKAKLKEDIKTGKVKI